MELQFLALLFSCLNLTVLPADQTLLIGSHQPIVALVGDGVLLPCHLEPAVSATHETVVWSRPDLIPEYVHYHQDGRLLFEKQHPSYFLRTRLFMDELPRGNVSMKIFKVKLSDAGTYKCSLPAMKKEADVQLIVGQSDVIGSDQPVEALVGDDVMLPCHLEPPLDVTTLSVEWRRGPALVHFYTNRRDDPVSQDQNFKGRTSLFQDEMTRGNISLKLTNVTEQDAGNYSCSVSNLKRSYVTLVVEPRPASDRDFHTIFIVIIPVIAVIAFIIVAVFQKNKKKRQSDVIGSDQPVKVLVDNDVMLPCHLEPPLDVTTLSVECRRGPALVHVYTNRRDDPVSQDQNFKAERQTLRKTSQSSDHSTASDDEEKQFLSDRNSKLTTEAAEVKSKLHEKEEKILQQQNINMRRVYSSPAIYNISLSAGLCHRDQSTAASTNSSPLRPGNKDPNGASLNRQHLSESTLLNNRFAPLAFLN